MGAALSHQKDDRLEAHTRLPQVEKSRREIFEDQCKPPAQVYPPISLRDDGGDHFNQHQPVASTSKASFTTPSTCSYSTLAAFRAQDKDRQGRLRKLFNTLRQGEYCPTRSFSASELSELVTSILMPFAYIHTEWSLPHDHNAHSHSHVDEGSKLEAHGRQPTADEKRVEVINKEYLSELYHSLCPGDEAIKGKGPSFQRFTDFVEAKEQGMCKVLML